MIEGTVMTIVGSVLLFFPTIERALAAWRGSPRQEVRLLGAYPTPATSRGLAELVAEADAAIERDALSRGVRRAAATYRAAARD